MSAHRVPHIGDRTDLVLRWLFPTAWVPGKLYAIRPGKVDDGRRGGVR